MQALLLNAIAGRLDRLRQALDQARGKVGAIFITGDLVDPAALPADPLREEEAAAAPYVAIFDALGALHQPIYLVPGEHDAPLPIIARAVRHSGAASLVQIVHRTAAYLGAGDTVAGFGGALVDDETASAPWRLPAWEARVAFEHLAAFNTLFQLAPRRVLLFSSPPRAARLDYDGEAHTGVQALNGVIRVQQPQLVACGGPVQGRNIEMIEGSVVVNPGALACGDYALVDLDTLKAQLRRLPQPLEAEAGAVHTVVVALDGSPPSWHALEIAAGIARRQGARIVLMHAFEHVPNALGTPFGEQALAERTLRGEQLLEEAAGFLSEAEKEIELLEGPPAEAILRVAESYRADLIVMGARGGGLRVLLGSVSQKVLRHASCSVLITRQPPNSEALRDHR